MRVVEFVSLQSIHAGALAQFLETLTENGDSDLFHPHALTPEAARLVADRTGSDVYAVALIDGQVVAYGMLRGWDEGFEVPSLGIAVHPGFRSCGLGVAFMGYLHVQARLRGAKSVRLRVSPENCVARHMYERLGYVFEGEERSEAVGVLRLVREAVDQSDRRR